MSRLKQATAFIGVAVAAWIAQSTLALTDAGHALDRVALLPLSAGAGVVSLGAGVLAAVLVRLQVPLAAFSPLVLCTLPFLPAPVPPGFLTWSGPVALLPWVAVMAAAASAWRARGWPVRRPVVAAGLLAALVFFIAARSVAPTLPGGDEPHYLIITQSLLNDGDLRIQNNHDRKDYLAYFGGELRPDFLKRGRDGQIYSIHSPGLPAIVAPAFLVAGYPGVVIFLVLVSALGSALAWHLAWLQTGRRDAAWFAWATVTIGATPVFHAFSIYPDGLGGVVVLTGAWALLRIDSAHAAGARDERVWPWFLHGVALSALPWLHTRFALLAGTLGSLILFRIWSTPRRIRKALAFTAVPALSCASWLAYFAAIYGVADPSAPYGGEIGSASYIADGLTGLFFDQRFGLLVYSPVLVFALAGFVTLRRRLAIELLLVVVPYLLLVTSFRMWWAGWSAPARFAVPVVPLLAIPAAGAWAAIRRRGTRATAVGALVLTGVLTVAVAGIDHGRLAYNTRTEPSLLLRRCTRNVDLARALPAWSVPGTELFRDVAIWCAAMLAAWAGVRALDRRAPLGTRPALAAATAGIFAVGAMAAASIVWRTAGVRGTSPVAGQAALLRRAAGEPHALLVGVQPPRALDRDKLPHEMRIRPVPVAPDDGAPLFVLPALPAGEYRLRPGVRGPGGRLTVGIDGESSPLRVVSTVTSDPIVLRLPVSVRSVVIRGDDEARRNVRALVVEPLTIVRPADRLSVGTARRAAAYGRINVFFLDDRAFPESEGFWVGGARDSSIVVQPDTGAQVITLLIHNAPIENHLTIQRGRWAADLVLQAGEERRIDVPVDAPRGAALIRFRVSSGFRPADVDRTSRDERYLGAWIKVL